MSEHQLDAQRLAQSIAQLRQAEKAASLSLRVLTVTLNIVANEHRVPFRAWSLR